MNWTEITVNIPLEYTDTAAAIATMTGNATMAIIAARVRTGTATTSTIADRAANVWKKAVCVTTVNSALNAASARTNAAAAMKSEKRSARTAAKNVPGVIGSAANVRNVPTA